MTEGRAFPVFVDTHAEQDIQRIDSWWRKNAASPLLFRDELAHMLFLLASSPQMGIA